MTRIIFLHQSKRKIAVNAEMIVWFEPSATPDKETVIHLTDGNKLVVDEGFDAVNGAIRQGP